MLSDMDDDPVDVDFLAWAKANALPNDREAWARALGNSTQQSRRRLIRTEFSHKWISTCVATLMERYGCKKDPAVVQATTEFHVAERTVRNALSLYAYRLDAAREPLSSVLQHNLKIAEGSGNLLPRLRRRLPPNACSF